MPVLQLLDATALISFLTLFAGAMYIVFKILVRASPQQQPPGPPGVPIFGNGLQIPSDHQWLKWHEWQQEYGDVMRVTVLGETSIVLSSLKAANDLLENRGNIYSDRPPAIMAGELVGWNRGLGYAPGGHNPRFREFRRLFHQFMGPRACASDTMKAMQERENIRLLNRLLDDPGNFAIHARDATSSTILLMSYGYPSDRGDPLKLVKIAEDAMLGFSQASEPGRWWVDSFPALKYIPSWLPGATFKRVASSMRADLDRLYDVPFGFVKDEMSTGKYLPSFISEYLEEKGIDVTPQEEEIIKAAAASLYSGGAETTPSAITSLILAMTLYPDVQARAYAQLQDHLRKATTSESESRLLPDFSDRESLPYISAILLEVWRWNPSVPLGLPHLVTQDDVYRGYHIQKGSAVWANIWSILHDEEIFPDPFEFRPERYLDSAGNLQAGKDAPSEVVRAAFGFGRRICPGMYLAENSVYIAIATILTVFEISKVVDAKTGVEIVPKVQYDGFISHPQPFPCFIKPRSSEIAAFVKRKLDDLA